MCYSGNISNDSSNDDLTHQKWKKNTKPWNIPVKKKISQFINNIKPTYYEQEDADRMLRNLTK